MRVFSFLLMKAAAIVERLLAFANFKTLTDTTNFDARGSIVCSDGFNTFSSTKYIELPNEVKSTNNAEYIFKFKTASYLTWDQLVIVHCENLFNIEIYYDHLVAYNFSTRRTDTLFYVGTSTTYWVKVLIDGTHKVIQYSTDGKLYTEVYNQTDSAMTGATTYPLRLGLSSYDSSRPYNGVIYLPGTSVTIDGSEVFNGNIAEVIHADDIETQIDTNYVVNYGAFHFNNKFALTGFNGTSNYINIPVVSPTTHLDFVVKAHTPGSLDGHSIIQSYQAYSGIIVRLYNNYIAIWMSSNGNSWDIASGFNPNLTIPRNSDVFIRVRWDGTTYTFGYSIDGSEYTYGNTLNSTQSVNWLSGLQGIGGCAWESYAFRDGVIYPQESYLVVDNAVVWRGVTNPLIVGSPVALNDGMANSKYTWEAYDASTQIKGPFTRNSIIKSITKDTDGNTVYEVEDFDVEKNEATITVDVSPSFIHTYGGDPNNIVNYTVNQDNAEIISDTTATQSLSTINSETHKVFDMDFIYESDTVEITGQKYNKGMLPAIFKKGTTINYVKRNTDGTLRYVKTHILNYNTYFKAKQFKVVPDVSGCTITYNINTVCNAYEENITCYHNDVISYRVEKDHFVPVEGSYTVKYTDVAVELPITMVPLYTFTIDSNVDDTIVELAVDKEVYTTNSKEFLSGTVIKWKAYKDGYYTQAGTYTISDQNHTLQLVLEPVATQYTAVEYAYDINNFGCSISKDNIVQADGYTQYFDTSRVFDFTNATSWEIETVYTYDYTQHTGTSTVFGNRVNEFGTVRLHRNVDYFYIYLPKFYNTYLTYGNTNIRISEFRRYHFYVGQTDDYTYYVDYQYDDYDFVQGKYLGNWTPRTRTWTYKPTITNKKIRSVNTLCFLAGYTTDMYTRGSIDLNNTRVTIDGAVVWSGIKHFNIGDMVALNNGIGESSYTWTAMHMQPNNITNLTEYGVVENITEINGDTILTLTPAKISEQEVVLTSSVDSDIHVTGNLPNITLDVVAVDDSNIQTKSYFDATENLYTGRDYVVYFEQLANCETNVEIGGQAYAIEDFPVIAPANSTLVYTVLHSGKVYEYKQLLLKQNIARRANTINITCEQEDAIIKINEEETNSIQCYLGQIINYEVTLDGYKTYNGIYEVKLLAGQTTEHGYTHNLHIELEPLISLSVDTNPGSSVVALDSLGYTQEGKSVKTLPGSIIIDGEHLKESEYYNSGCLIEDASFYTVEIVPTPATANVLLTAVGSSQEGNTISVRRGTTVYYKVSDTAFDPTYGSLVVTADTSVPVTLREAHLFTLIPTPSDARVTLTTRYHEQIAGTNTIYASVGEQIDYRVSMRGYRTVSGTYTMGDSQSEIYVALEESASVELDLSYPFDNEYFVDELGAVTANGNMVVNDGMQALTSPLSTRDNAMYNSYFSFTTPAEETTFSVTGYVSSEGGYDYGCVYVGTSVFNMSRDAIRDNRTDGNGQYLFRGSGSMSQQTYTMTLEPDTTYYVNFGYGKDGSASYNDDKLIVTNMKFTKVF